MRAHRFDPIDRGAGHVHRYTAHCSCDWFGVHRKTKAAARRVWQSHVNGEQRRARRRMPERRPLTPRDRLPEQLRSIA